MAHEGGRRGRWALEVARLLGWRAGWLSVEEYCSWCWPGILQWSKEATSKQQSRLPKGKLHVRVEWACCASQSYDQECDQKIIIIFGRPWKSVRGMFICGLRCTQWQCSSRTLENTWEPLTDVEPIGVHNSSVAQSTGNSFGREEEDVLGLRIALEFYWYEYYMESTILW